MLLQYLALRLQYRPGFAFSMPDLTSSLSDLASSVPGLTSSSDLASSVSGLASSVPGLASSIPDFDCSVPGIVQQQCRLTLHLQYLACFLRTWSSVSTWPCVFNTCHCLFNTWLAKPDAGHNTAFLDSSTAGIPLSTLRSFSVVLCHEDTKHKMTCNVSEQ